LSLPLSLECGTLQIGSIPAVGASGIWAYYTGGWRYLFRAPEMVEEGCRKYRGRVFRVPRLFRWDFIISGSTLVQEAVTAAENVLSLAEANREAHTFERHTEYMSNTQIVGTGERRIRPLPID
jgi:hypothetical protein